MERHMLFDASSIFMLIRELKGEAPNKLLEGSTIPLAYYELGNAVWRECFLLKRISKQEAGKLLSAMAAILQAMDIVMFQNDDKANLILDKACELGITYYDAAYVVEAQKSEKVLVTDDQKLASAAHKIGVKTMTSKTLIG
jgi:predicted nucleic acid-binding protein